MARNDEFTQKIMQGYYKDVEFTLVDEHGVAHVVRGGWTLVDGGFLKFGCFIDPKHERLVMDS